MNSKNSKSEVPDVLEVFFEGSNIDAFKFNGEFTPVDQLAGQATTGIMALSLLSVATALHNVVTPNESRISLCNNLPEPLMITLRNAARRPPKWLATIFRAQTHQQISQLTFFGEKSPYFVGKIQILIYKDEEPLTTRNQLLKLKNGIKEIFTNESTPTPDSPKLVEILIQGYRRDSTHFIIGRHPSKEYLSASDIVSIFILHPSMPNFYVFWLDSANKLWPLHPTMASELNVESGITDHNSECNTLRIPRFGALPEIKSSIGHETCLSLFVDEELDDDQKAKLTELIILTASQSRSCHQRLAASSFQTYQLNQETHAVSNSGQYFGSPTLLTVWEEKLVKALEKEDCFHDLFIDISFQNISNGDWVNYRY